MKTYKNALIVDDDVDLCMTLKSVLSSTIPHITTVYTIDEARKVLQDLLPEVVFLDNNLPDGQGLTLVKEIKAKWPAAFIIFITAVDATRQEALDNGVDVFLEKPLTYSAILNALTNLDRIQQQE